MLVNARSFRDGYIFKEVACKGLQVVDGLPPMDELQKFNAAKVATAAEGEEGADDDVTGMGALMAALPAQASGGLLRAPVVHLSRRNCCPTRFPP